MNDVPTPPPRRLPSEVRERIRDRVLNDLTDAPRSRFLNSRGPLAVAAGVAVLAAGAMIVAQSVDNGGGTGGIFPPTRPTTSTSAPPAAPDAGAELNRCFGAVRAAGKINQFPDRRLWRPVASRNYRRVTLTAAVIGDKPLFCQTTETSVTITDPSVPTAFAKGTRTGAVLMSDEGIVAGVVDPSWSDVSVSIGSKTAGIGTGAPADILPNGLFVTVSSLRLAGDTKVDVSGGGVQAAALPRPTAPAIEYLRDRPTNPPPDRTSDRARMLVDCLAKSITSVVDPDSWQPAAMVAVEGSWIMLMHHGTRVAYCTFENTKPVAPNRYLFHEIDKQLPSGLTRPKPIDGTVLNLPNRGVLLPMFGTVPSGATKMTLRFTDGTTAAADVFGSTFMVALKADQTVAAALVFDGAGTLIYEGPLN